MAMRVIPGIIPPRCLGISCAQNWPKPRLEQHRVEDYQNGREPRHASVNCAQDCFCNANRYGPLSAERAQSRWSAAQRAIPLRRAESGKIVARFPFSVGALHLLANLFASPSQARVKLAEFDRS